MKKAWTPFLLALLTFPLSGRTEGERTGQIPVIGYRDADGDKRNDLFRDADGNGVNDVTGKPYPHRFRFKDENGDGLNDLFRDADGDGLNDIAAASGNRQERDVTDRVIDADGDGVNDITGKRYAPESFRKERFIDENADGLNDRGPGQSAKARIMERRVDRFSDGDGDGINDGRGIERNNRNRVKEIEERGMKGKSKSRGSEK